MKIFKILAVALVAMLGFTACDKECGHDFIEYDYSKDLVGTWTCLTANYAEALVINADGSVVSTGVEDGEYWEGVKGNIKTVNNKMTMTFEDDDNWEGRFEMVAGEAFTIYEENGESFTFNYCKKDLADEVVGMWVCNDSFSDEQDMMIQTFYENGKCTLAGYLPQESGSEQVKNETTDYKVVGDLLFIAIPAEKAGGEKSIYVVDKLIYTPDGTAHGDILTMKTYPEADGVFVESVLSFLRIKQYLELPGMKYDYIKTFVTNVKGADRDVDFMGYTFNFAKMDGVVLDKMLKTVLFAVQFPDANTIRYTCRYNDFNMEMDAPIEVDGNKMTIKMSERDAAYKDVDLYTFQDQDNTQMHIYMPTYAFETFFANMQIAFMSELGQLDKTDAAAVEAVFNSIDEAVETINLSLVMTKAVIK